MIFFTILIVGLVIVVIFALGKCADIRFQDTVRERDSAYETIRKLRACLNAPAVFPETAELLRRSYHAIRILHDFRSCKWKDCDYCRLAQEIVGQLGTRTIMEDTTTRKRAGTP
jgi:hypothetical protein